MATNYTSDSKPAHNRKWNHKASFGYTLELLDQFLLMIIYQQEGFETKVINLLKIARRKATIRIRNDRHFPRKTITPPSEFYRNNKPHPKKPKKTIVAPRINATKKAKPVKILKDIATIYSKACAKRPLLVPYAKKIRLMFRDCFEKIKVFLL